MIKPASDLLTAGEGFLIKTCKVFAHNGNREEERPELSHELKLDVGWAVVPVSRCWLDWEFQRESIAGAMSKHKTKPQGANV